MKLASILFLVALVASPFSASAEDCTVSGEYFLLDETTPVPTSEDSDFAGDSLLTSYDAVHNVSSGEVQNYWSSPLTITGGPGESEEKQVAGNLRGKVGASVYSAYLSAGFSVSCHLCGNDDDDSVASSAVINPAVSVIAGEKRFVAQKKHQEEKWLGLEDVVNRWEETWCDELVGWDYPFDTAFNCTIDITCV
jgi:hypothetical protein